jgi:hypothetical protein
MGIFEPKHVGVMTAVRRNADRHNDTNLTPAHIAACR